MFGFLKFPLVWFDFWLGLVWFGFVPFWFYRYPNLKGRHAFVYIFSVSFAYAQWYWKCNTYSNKQETKICEVNCNCGVCWSLHLWKKNVFKLYMYSTRLCSWYSSLSFISYFTFLPKLTKYKSNQYDIINTCILRLKIFLDLSIMKKYYQLIILHIQLQK